MLIGYDRPAMTWSLSGGDASVVGDWTLGNGQPRDVTRIQWDSGAQTTATVVYLTGSFAAASVVRVGAVLGIALDAGLKVTIKGKRPVDGGYTYDLGGNSQSQRTVRMADGSVGIWWVFDDGLDAVDSVQLAIYNDFDGVVGIDASAYVDLGEAWVSPAQDVPAEKGWRQGTQFDDYSQQSLGHQPWPLRFANGRALRVTLARQRWDEVYGTPASGINLATLGQRIAQGKTSVAIPRSRIKGALDTESLHATAQLGLCTHFDLIEHRAGQYFTGAIEWAEAPAAPMV